MNSSVTSTGTMNHADKNAASIIPCTPPGMILHEEIALKSGKQTLRGYLEGPADAIQGDSPCPLIILLHGLMDSSEFPLIRRQADAYTARGYAVLAMDFHGHGNSDGDLLHMTVSGELADAETILAYAQALPFVSRIILIGHSQGGVVASITAARHSREIDRLVLLAPAGMLADRFRKGRCFGTDFDPRNPPEKVPVFDAYVGRDYITDAMQMDLYGLADGYQGHRVLLIAGAADPLVTEDTVQAYREVYAKEKNHNATYFHMIADASHDFHEKEEELAATVLQFLEDRTC